MKHLLILISFLLLSSSVIGDYLKGETLYQWGECCDYKWMGFGDKDLHPIYKGQVMDGKPNGLGFLIYPDGSKYVGEYKDGKKNGQGTSTFSNGGKYVGEFKDGLPNGQGTETFSNGEKYIGEFKDGKFHGQGTKTWSDGMYVGKYRDGKLSTGIFYDKNRNNSFKVVNGRMIKQ